MRRGIGSTIDPGVFWISLVISILFVLWGVLFTDNLAGGLDGLQTAAIISAAPFVLVMIGLCWSIFKELRSERLPGVAPERAAVRPRGTAALQHTSSLDRESGG